MSDIRRTYFTFPATFDPDNPTKWGTVLKSIKIDNVETLTTQYYQDIDPDGEPNVDYAYCYEMPNGSNTCNILNDVNTYNPFLVEDGDGNKLLLFDTVDGYFRGKVTGIYGGADYGLGILEIGVSVVNAFYAENYPELTDIREAKGSIFFDIDYDFDFKAVFWVYEDQVIKFSYTMEYDKETSTLKYYREENGVLGKIDVMKHGWLSGIESNPYITPPQPTDPTCIYAVRTLGYTVPVKMPKDEAQVVSDCCKALFVFASSTSDSRDFNDFTSDYYYRSLISDTVSFTLYDVDNDSGIVITDNTYGSYYDFNSFDTQPGLKGVIVEWNLVLTLLGPGNYQINKQIQTAGKTINIEGIIFALKEYTAQSADRTIRITSIQNGDIAHLGVSFKGVQWPSSIRIPGYFGGRKPKYTQDNITYRDYQNRQVSMTQENKYVLKSEPIKDCIFKELMDYMIFGNELYISDYNIHNHSDYKNVAVELSDSADPDYLLKRSLLLELEFTDRLKNRFKANYGLTQIAGSQYLEGVIGEPPVVPPPSVDIIVIKGYFTVAGEDDMPPIVIDNDTAGVFPTLLFDSGSGSVQIVINTIPVSAPYILIPGDILDASRTNDTTTGWYKIQT